MLLWWLATLALAQPCPDRDTLLRDVRTALSNGEIDEAKVLEERLLEAFGCGTRAAPDELAGFWLARAAREDLGGGLDAANLALQGARRLSDAYDDAYGAALGRRWNDAHLVAILPSRLAVSTGEPTYPMLLVDGFPFEPPGLLEAGLHLLQWGRSEDDIVGASVVLTEADAVTTVDVPYGRPDLPPPPKTRTGRSPALLVVAGVTGVGALVTAGLTAAAGPPANVDNVDVGAALEQRFARQRALGLTSFGLMTASTVSLGVHILR